MKHLYLIGPLALIMASCNTQDKLADDLSPVTDSAQVLSQNTEQIAEYVVEVYEDRQGNMWFGTMSFGAVRYDGDSLTYFTPEDGLCGYTITSYAEDAEGNLWIGSHSGLSKYDGSSFTTERRTSGRHDTGDGWMSVHNASDGVMWASDRQAVYRYDGAEFIPFDLPLNKEQKTTYAITPGAASHKLTDSHGNLWFGTDGYGALKFDGSSFTRYTSADGLCSNNINAIVEDDRGRIWFACMQSFQPKMTGDGGVCRLDGSTFVQFEDFEGLHHNDIYSLYADRRGNVWIGATGVGLYRYNGDSFTTYSKTNRMDLTAKFGCQSIFESTDGTIWLGFSGGLFRLEDTEIINVTKDGFWE